MVIAIAAATARLAPIPLVLVVPVTPRVIAPTPTTLPAVTQSTLWLPLPDEISYLSAIKQTALARGNRTLENEDKFHFVALCARV